MTPIIYLIPGFLTNETIYRDIRVQLNNPTEVIEFIPALQNESLADYAKRMCDKIDSTQPFYLMGTSFGGMLAIEMSKHVKPEKLILISSAKHRGELSLFMRQEKAASKFLPLIPEWVIKQTYTRGFEIGGKFIPRFKSIYRDDIRKMINSIDGRFEKWVMRQFTKWDGKNHMEDVLHIHGDDDRVFPIKRIKDVKVIKGGSHAIILNRYKEVANLINAYLK